MGRMIPLIIFLWLLGIGAALSQSNPGLAYRQVPTAAQWNSYFASKQDVLGYLPLNSAGGVMTGKLTTSPSSGLQAGFNIPMGSAPTSPADGDIWTTTGGMFARINGVTAGPFNYGAFANPTATAGPAAINGAATTYMRSDAAPAVQVGSSSQKGIVQVDGTTIVSSSGVISAPSGTSGNPTATAGPTAVNGVSTSYMRSDAAPAIQKGSDSQFGIVEGDGVTVTCVTGVCRSKLGAMLQANPASKTVTSTTGLMGGFGSTCAITPVKTGRLLISFMGVVGNSAGVPTNNSTRLYYGTGTAPANGAALTGTALGNGPQNTYIPNPQQTTISLSAAVSGLTLGTAVWIDVSMFSGSGAFTLSGASCTATEF